MFSGHYKKVIKDNTQCNAYVIVTRTEVVDPDALTDIEREMTKVVQPVKSCIPIGNETKLLFGEGGYTQGRTIVERAVNAIRHNRGGSVFFGDDPALYQSYSVPTPIINGLRGGVVPIKMRTNRF